MKNKSPADPSKQEFIEFDHEKQEIRIQITSQQKLIIISVQKFIMAVVYLNAKDKVLDYRLDKLPSKLKVWHKYVSNFI